MIQFRSNPGRSRRECVVRLALAIIATLVGYGMIAKTLAAIMMATAPEAAHRLDPSNGQITGLVAQRMLSADASTAVRHSMTQLGELALTQDATSVAALVALGSDAQMRGDIARARRFFTYSQMLSRRDLPTQLWFVETAVARNDVAGALEHYDIALRTSPSAAGTLFPILTSAIDDSGVRAPLVALLYRAKPNWTANFIGFAANSGTQLSATALLFAELHQKGVVVFSRGASVPHKPLGRE